jgi:transcriptional regulator with XRE-family HTH domain
VGRQRDPIAPCSPARHALISWLRDAVDAAGLSYDQLAREIGCHRSSISRALSGRHSPTWPVIERIAARCGVSVTWARSLARDAGVACHRGGLRVGSGGHPPAELADYIELRRALRDLLTWAGVSQREVVRRDSTGMLRRSTVGAVLRGERSASREVTIAIVRACEVSEAAVAAWAAVWDRLGRPFREAMDHQRRQLAYAQLGWHRTHSYLRRHWW